MIKPEQFGMIYSPNNIKEDTDLGGCKLTLRQYDQWKQWSNNNTSSRRNANKRDLILESVVDPKIENHLNVPKFEPSFNAFRYYNVDVVSKKRIIRSSSSEIEKEMNKLGITNTNSNSSSSTMSMSMMPTSSSSEKFQHNNIHNNKLSRSTRYLKPTTTTQKALPPKSQYLVPAYQNTFVTMNDKNFTLS